MIEKQETQDEKKNENIEDLNIHTTIIIADIQLMYLNAFKWLRINTTDGCTAAIRERS